LNSEAIQKYYANTPSAKWLVLVSICLTNFLNSVTNSSVNVATPSIASALQANAILVSWIPTSFLLSSVVMLLPAQHRGTSLGIASASVYFGLSCGPLIGGWFTEVYGWRSVFLFPVSIDFSNQPVSAVHSGAITP
jgi:MFS family permease